MQRQQCNVFRKVFVNLVTIQTKGVTAQLTALKFNNKTPKSKIRRHVLKVHV